MTAVFQIMDCLCPRMFRVGMLQKYRDVMGGSGAMPRVFAVFDKAENFLGLVTALQAGLFPARVFSDLLVLREPQPISLTTPLDVVVARFKDEKIEFIAVVDEGKFIGVVSEASLFAALIKKLEAELDYRKLATLVFENTAEGVLITDPDAHIVDVNSAFSKTTGYAREEVLGKSPNLLHSGLQDKAFYEGMWKTLLEVGAWEGELWNRRKTGDIYPEWLHINAVRDSEGRVVNYVGVFSDVGPNREIQRQLQQLAFYDPLTALPNRRLFNDRLEHTVLQASRQNEAFALLFIDLNRFKNINDAFGHAAGDKLLKHVGKTISGAVRECDTVARLGGDEFTVILSDCHETRSAVAVAKKISNALNDPVILDDCELLASAAIGISLYPKDGNSAEEMTKNADIAMFNAKSEGVAFCFYSLEMNSGVVDQLALESAIRTGVAKGEFWLAWQPQVRLSDNTITGAEVLARWRHEGQDISPCQFIPVAENSGQIGQLGEWIFRTAMAELAEFKKSCAVHPFQAAVNFSPLQLKNDDASQLVSEMLAQYPGNRGCLEVEITESALVDGPRGAKAFLSKLRELEVDVAVDDFGTGYSNLSNLKRIHIDRLKIDQSFVFDLTENQTSRQIVEAIIRMARSLGMSSLAEGVETKEQADMLREMSCDYAQGYFFSHPVAMSELKALCLHSVDGKLPTGA